MTLTQFDLALIFCALHTERANSASDAWMREHLTRLINEIGRALEATAAPEHEETQAH